MSSCPPHPVSERHLLLTGASGLLGSEVARRLLAREDVGVLWLPLRPGRQGESVAQRGEALLRSWRASGDDFDVSRVRFFEFDWDSPTLGMSESEASALAHSLTDLVHCAASVDLDASLEEARSSNFRPTESLLVFLERLGGRTAGVRFHQVSTYAVARAGDRDGRIALEVEVPSFRDPWRNFYEQSKAEAETLVLRSSREKGRWCRIYRTSILAGDSRTGWTSKFDGIYSILRLFLSAQDLGLKKIPVFEDARLECLSVDSVADGLVALVLDAKVGDSSGQICHLTAGDEAPSLLEVLQAGARWVRANQPEWALPEFEVVAGDVPDRLEFCLTRLAGDLGVEPSALPRALSILLPYATGKMVFERARAVGELSRLGVRLVPVSDFLPELLSYAVRTHWGELEERRPRLRHRGEADPIVISALGFRLPGASTLGAFASILARNESQLREIPRERWDPVVFLREDWSDREEEGSACRLAGVVDESEFDPGEFRITPRTAQSMDRLQKLVLLATRDLVRDLDSRGDFLEKVDRQRVACVLGHSGVYLENDYRFGSRVARNFFKEGFEKEWGPLPEDLLRRVDGELQGATPPISEDALPGSLANVAAGRIMNAFDFHGSSWVVGAGASSGLAALEQASGLLLNDEADFVIAGAGQAILDPLLYVTLSAEGALSPEAPAPFSPDARGSVPGEGVILFGLCRRSYARDHGLKEYAELAAIARASGGQALAITTPSSSVLRESWEKLDEPRAAQAGFGLELHASGVREEDQAEADFVRRSFLPEQLEHVGTQKPLFGHLMGASSALSVLKAVTSLASQTWQGTCVHPQLGFSGEKPQTLLGPASVGVVAFGFAGPAYTALLKRPAREDEPSRPRDQRLLPARPRKRAKDPIALVSLGATLPGARTASNFPALLRQAKPQFRALPAELWEGQRAAFYAPDLEGSEDRTHSLLGAFVTPITVEERERFASWGIPPYALDRMDPNHLHFFRAAAEVLGDSTWKRPEDATRFGASVGESSSSMRGAWWLGKRLSFRNFRQVLEREQGRLAPQLSKKEWRRRWEAFEEKLLHDVPRIDEDSGPGALLPFSLARLAKALDLRGGYWVSDAACASSLSALSVAVRELRLRRLDAVLWGGVGMSVGPLCNIFFSRCQALSQRGSFPFDQNADGIVLGEGSVLAVLKRLEDAERDGDRILGVLEGMGGASDGRGTAIMAPSVGGQVRAMREAFADSGVAPDSIQFVECHATGTAVGDPIEIAALSEAYQTASREEPLRVGAVKGIVGHTVGAAGAVGVLKVLAGFEAQEFFAQPVATQENAALELAARKMLRPARNESWIPGRTSPRRAAVSSFGFGGTNWHAIWSEPPRRSGPRLLARARERAGALSPVFCFPGHGSPYPQMGRPYYESSAAFRALIDEANPSLKRLLGRTFEELVYDSDSSQVEQTLYSTEFVQPLLLTANLAFYRMVRSQGIRPRVLLGHSVGEFSAAVAAGILSLENALEATFERGRIYREAQRQQGADLGAMLALRSSRREVESLLASAALSGLGLAALNAPTQTVVSGPRDAIRALQAQSEDRQIQNRLLPVEVAWHSRLAGELGAASLERVLQTFEGSVPQVPLVRCSEAAWLEEGEAVPPAALVSGFIRQLSEPIDFVRMIDRVKTELTLRGEVPAFLEVGPGSVLNGLIRENEPGSAGWIESVDFPKGSGLKSAFQLPSGLSRAVEQLGRGGA